MLGPLPPSLTAPSYCSKHARSRHNRRDDLCFHNLPDDSRTYLISGGCCAEENWQQKKRKPWHGCCLLHFVSCCVWMRSLGRSLFIADSGDAFWWWPTRTEFVVSSCFTKSSLPVINPAKSLPNWYVIRVRPLLFSWQLDNGVQLACSVVLVSIRSCA
jgi:hypothetical protein